VERAEVGLPLLADTTSPVQIEGLHYGRVIRAACEEPWAILPEKLQAISDFLTFAAGGGKFTAEEIRARIGESDPLRLATQFVPVIGAFDGEPSAAPPPSGRYSDETPVVAVMPIVGTLRQRVGPMEATSGLMGTDQIGNALRQLANDDRVTAIVLDIDSPGGGVYGCDELATQIYELRERKPIVAVANSLAASAAYYIAASASEVVVTPSGEVGSIGVWRMHVDQSKALEMLGLDVTLISAGKFKTEGNPFEPLGEEALQALQAQTDRYYGDFVKSVARGRGVSVSDVRKGFGEGRVVGAQEAVRIGMADRVETLRATVERMARPKARTGGSRPRQEVPAEAVASQEDEEHEAEPQQEALSPALSQDGSGSEQQRHNPEELAEAIARHL